jgi:magnesium-transporting ATPase (P-type)
VAAASGATFLTVVLGQAANAFACRSTNRPVWLLPFFSNRYLFAGLAFGLSFSLATLLVPPVARFFEQGRPPLIGWIVALTTMPVILLADGWVKHHARRRSVRRPPPRRR